MKKIVYILLAAIALAGIIFGVVKLSDNKSLRAQVDELNQQIETITADATAAYYEAKANMEAAVKAAQDEAQSTIDALNSQVEELTKAAEEAARQAAEAASDAVEDVKDAVTDTVEDATEDVADAIESVTGAAEETAEEAAAPAEADADPVLVTYDGEEIRLSQVDNALYSMYQNGYVDDLSDYDTAIAAVLQDKVLSAKIEDLGLNQFTPEEEEALRADAEAEWQDALDTYVNYFLTEDTDEARAAAYQEAELYYNA